MIMIKTYLDKSHIEGIGLFAGENIKQGTVVCRFVEGFDRIMSKEHVEFLPEMACTYVKKYGFFYKGTYTLNTDNDRYTNHSDIPNTKLAENGDSIACKDIRKGEEITANYGDLDPNWEKDF